jgi:hypothetical protein
MPEHDDLNEQLRAYVERTSVPVAASEARARGERHIARRRRAGLTAIATVALVAVGGTIALAGRDEGGKGAPAGTTVSTPHVSVKDSSTTVGTVPCCDVPTTTSSTGMYETTGTWGSFVTAGDGVWALRRQPSAELVHLDPATGIVLAKVNAANDHVAWINASVHKGGATLILGGSRPSNTRPGTVTAFEGVTLGIKSQFPVADGPVAIAGSGGAAVWIAGDHTLTRAAQVGHTHDVAPTHSFGGAPIVDIAADPSGQRLYVEQFDARQRTLLTVLSAVDAHVIVAAKAVDSGPGPGRIAAGDNGVWLVQPSGTQAHLQRYLPSLLQAGHSLSGPNSMPVRVDHGLVLVNIPGAPGTEPGIRCVDPELGEVRAKMPVSSDSSVIAYASDGAHLYLAIADLGIQVRAIDPTCLN